MKLNIQNTINAIRNIRIAIDAKLVEWKPTVSPTVLLAKLEESGEVENLTLNEITVNVDGTLGHGGKRYIVYIRDRNESFYLDKGLPTFHIADCITLRNARIQNRFNKYVATTETSGNFKVNIISNHGNKKVDTRNEKLKVCINCLKHLNYKNYFEQTSRRQYQIRDDFSIDDFLKNYKSTDVIRPKYDDATAPLNDYPANWEVIKAEQRRRKNYTCENKNCGENLKDYPHFLDTHHINRRKDDNSAKNLMLLCAACHAEQGDDHKHLTEESNYKEFVEYLKVINSPRRLTLR